MIFTPTRLTLPIAAVLVALAGTAAAQTAAPSVTVATATRQELRETVVASGSFVAREEILVAPEVDGLTVVEILAEEGDRVAAGQVLARLNREMLDVQLAQNAAQISRAAAAVAQAKSQIAEATASRTLAEQQLERTQQLQRTGSATNDVLDQRTTAARTAGARVESATNALALAEADLVLARAQRRDIELRIARTEIKAKVGGTVSRRTARLGALAPAAGDPLFRIIAESQVELEADVPETTLARMRPGQPAEIDAAGYAAPLPGRVRLVAPEVNRSNRLGRVRVTLTGTDRPPLGAFGRATVEVARSSGVTVPLSAVMFGQRTTVQVVKDGLVETREVVIGLRSQGRVEVREGLKEGEQVVAVSGSFVRNGDRVAPVAAVQR
ncbi:efflux RND transporter periplasmic adaptor subunit [Phreatobacter oligotrophus]|jgi:RND family efflux transporter MFP subunit|uniref:RND family efflux transporter MFP subunit n=1 Tax=Phreatobacter oligotrophus TaxID=1122261 RepID=A0A2T4YY08_9HYPH|nr:efflux RND transporter periplasmic adaptor subunit [Phreatobacter oligotrophus]PTM51404.1 RND family efflux transporter MFP subunit [Phreatobacter oligotrophus]